MVESSKILTVSYGTFSCTLEGFDDSFATMKAIAEYFRDLAAGDRYFGAEPPTPDAEMLTRIAEREISRRVEARTDESGIVLRAAALSDAREPEALASDAPAPREAKAPEAEAPAMPPRMDRPEPASLDIGTVATDMPADDFAEDEFAEDDEAEDAATFEEMADAARLTEAPAHPDADSVAAKLQRIRAVVGQGGIDLAEQSEDLSDPLNAEEDEYEEDVAADESPMSSDLEFAAEAEAEVEQAPAEEPVEAADAVDELAGADEAFSDDAADDEDVAETEIDTGAEDETLIEASVDSIDLSGLSEEDPSPSFEEQTNGHLSYLAADMETEEETSDAEAVDQDDETEASEIAEVEEDEPAEEAPVRKPLIRSRILRLARRKKPEPEPEAVPETDAVAAEEESEADTLSAQNDAIADSLAARLAAGFSGEEEPSEEVLTASDDDMPETSRDDDIAAMLDDADGAEDDAPVEDDRAEDAAAEEVATDFEQEEDAADAAEDEPLSDEDEADLREQLAEATRDDGDKKEDKGRAGRFGLPDPDDGAMDRISAQADQALSEPEGQNRRNAIAQLKAAVAATEAARQLGDSQSNKEETEKAFRSDLQDAVRPARPTRPVRTEAKTERPRPAPLKLVASQRIDTQEETSEPVSPRRVSTPDVSSTDAESFADFAAEMGASDLPDLLEAAAAYTAYVEGIEDFSRPQIMKKVQATSKEEFSREDGLRSFGTLLRQGRISKVRNGRFQVSEATRFKPEQKAG